MASFSTNSPAMAPAATPVAGVFERIGQWLVSLSSGTARMRRVEALNALSDEALARHGLRREDIVRHVFRDVYWM